MPLFDPNPVDCAAVLQVLAERHRDEEVRGGTKDYAVALEYAVDLFKREPLVQEVIRHATDFAALSKVAVDIPFSEHTKRTVARIEARSALLEAARKLADWSPT